MNHKAEVSYVIDVEDSDGYDSTHTVRAGNVAEARRVARLRHIDQRGLTGALPAIMTTVSAEEISQ